MLGLPRKKCDSFLCCNFCWFNIHSRWPKLELWASALLLKHRNIRILGKQRLSLWLTYMARFNQKKAPVTAVVSFFFFVWSPSRFILSSFCLFYGILRNNTAETHICCQSYLHVLSNYLQVKHAQREVNQQCIFTRLDTFVRPIIRSLSILLILLYGERIWVYYYGTLRRH